MPEQTVKATDRYGLQLAAKFCAAFDGHGGSPEIMEYLLTPPHGLLISHMIHMAEGELFKEKTFDGPYHASVRGSERFIPHEFFLDGGAQAEGVRIGEVSEEFANFCRAQSREETVNASLTSWTLKPRATVYSNIAGVVKGYSRWTDLRELLLRQPNGGKGALSISGKNIFCFPEYDKADKQIVIKWNPNEGWSFKCHTLSGDANNWKWSRNTRFFSRSHLR
jgi:hypothetical protein